MKPSDWINIALAYVVTVAIVNLIVHMIGYNRPVIALTSGAVVGTEVAAWSWQIRKAGTAPVSLKLRVGCLISALSLIESVAFQLIFKWMSHPASIISVIAITCLLLPLLTFEAFRQTIPVGKK